MGKLKLGKKGVMGPIISVFVLVLVVSILAGMSFLFITNLKTQVVSETASSGAIINETGYINSSGYALQGQYLVIGFGSPSITIATNATGDGVGSIPLANISIVNNRIYNTTSTVFPSVNFTYSFSYINESNKQAYLSVNKTEQAGATVVNYLSLIFLAIIFGAILTLVLKIILPYINFGQRFEGF